MSDVTELSICMSQSCLDFRRPFLDTLLLSWLLWLLQMLSSMFCFQIRMGFVTLTTSLSGQDSSLETGIWLIHSTLLLALNTVAFSSVFCYIFLWDECGICKLCWCDWVCIFAL